MPLKSKRSPAEREYLLEIDEPPTEECVTALRGVPLFVRTARSLDVPGGVHRKLVISPHSPFSPRPGIHASISNFLYAGPPRSPVHVSTIR